MSAWVAAMSRLNWVASQLSSFENTEYAAKRAASLADEFEADIQVRMYMSSLPLAVPQSPRVASPKMGYCFDNYTPDNRYPIEPAPSGPRKNKNKGKARGY